ncbi:MAG: response regulator [Melioribacteraceae bacterium]|mgnify:CR=1 FL=1|nr:hypothetical protein [Ignavibacteriota bacterium]MBZ0182855.1 response regulator [Melioribacteraceae bacterium]
MFNLLVVDDDKKLCEVLSEELNEIGYNADYVTTADDAINFVKSKIVDLMLLDLKMPDKDGFYVLHKLKELDTNVKTIVLTAFADVNGAMESAKLGALDFISKPYDLDELIIAIRKVLQADEQ